MEINAKPSSSSASKLSDVYAQLHEVVDLLDASIDLVKTYDSIQMIFEPISFTLLENLRQTLGYVVQFGFFKE